MFMMMIIITRRRKLFTATEFLQHARFHSLAAVQMRSSFFWDVVQSIMTATEVSRQPIGPLILGS